LQQSAPISPLPGHGLELSSIPQDAFSPVTDHFTAANSPQQMCEAIVRWIPESRISRANNMEITFFIQFIKRTKIYLVSEISKLF
jgi:hypothetical protein